MRYACVVANHSRGRLYVVDATSNAITEYAPGATGNAAPVASIAGSVTGISDPIGLVLDAQNRPFVSNADDNSITAYTPEANGDVAPSF
ncbi:MAG: hypothetical protein JO057_31425, partial [Chloroflexi bacterium]|nr:hypothetical protein [Chloroflexota bacterium]